MTQAKHNGVAVSERAAHGENGKPPARCPVTGRPCEGDLAYLCAYGCMHKAGLSPHSAENENL